MEKLFLGKLTARLPAFVRHSLTLLVVAFGWGIFYYTDMGLWSAFVGRLFSLAPDTMETLRFAAAYLPTGLIACVLATELPKKLRRELRRSRLAFLEIVLLGVLFVLCVAALVNQGYNPFIYFRF